MGMNVLGYDPVMGAEAFREAGLRKVELSDIWAQSDFISVHTPLTPETANLLGEANLSKCKKGVRVINCARGGIVDEAALLKMLESGHVAGAALDVFTSEPPKVKYWYREEDRGRGMYASRELGVGWGEVGWGGGEEAGVIFINL